jgi:hypothetical protein
MKIKDIKTALEIFEEACIKHSEATEQGDYKTCNKSYNTIVKAITFLKSKNAMSNLSDYLFNQHIGVRLWSACYWLPINEKEGIKILEEIIKSSGIISFTAETALSEWKKGNLKF